MTKIDKVLFTGKTHTTLSRRDGAARGAHGSLDLNLSGSNGQEQVLSAVQPHPTAEQLFAGAWSSCYITAIGLVAAQKKVTLPADLAVDIEVDLGQTGAEWILQARLNVRIPGLAQDVAEKLAHAADEICPYSKATRGNIEVALNVFTA
ncbi:Ohr family peroxiredoxin [Pseudomonas sp. GCM10022186]|uniref:Ohr family peroxiredoxin n=1 Tax=Pseudomonas sp. GCM10022186 TaxID=3252650 RepID=UPI003619AE3F